ncbi:MAG: putative bacterial extracellular solute-binding protein [Chlamydiales bacterium]|nr:putative bacterial extracellular solute-binding protein [Chlamydiales bacterium]
MEIMQKAYIRSLLSWLLLLVASFSCSKEAPKQKRSYRIVEDPLDGRELVGRRENVHAFLMELIDLAFEEEKLDVAFIHTKRSMEEDFQQGIADAALTHSPLEMLKRQSYLATDCWLYTGLVLVFPATASDDYFNETTSFKAAVQDLSPLGFQLSDYPNLIVAPYLNLSAALDDLLRGDVDGVIMPLLRAYGYSQGFYKDKIRINPLLLNQSGFRLVFPPEEKELVARLNKQIKRMKESGAYDRLIKKWDLCRADPLH